MTRSGWVCGATAVAAAAAILLMLFAQLMVSPLNHDEHPYIAAASLLGEARLYRDFGYNHMPYLPFVFRPLTLMAPDAPLLLLGRGLTFGLVGLAAIATAGIVGRLSRSWAAGILALLVFVLNSLIFKSDTIPIKDFGALAATLGGAAALLWAPAETGAGRWRAGFVGLAMGTAIGFKLPYLVFLAPALLALWLQPAPAGEARRDRIVSFLAGCAGGVLPLAVLAAGHLDVFWFCNWQYHKLYSENFYQAGMPGQGGRELGAKLGYLFHLASRDFSILGLFLGPLLLAVAAWAQPAASASAPRPAWDAAFAATAFGAALVIAMAPAPSWAHHFAVVVPFSLIVTAACLARLQGPVMRVGLATLVALGGLAALQNGKQAAAALAALGTPASWTPQRIQREADAVRAILGPPAGGDRIATLAPTFALAAGYAIYPELATGPFFFGVGHLVPADERDRLHLTAPDGIAALLAQAPPRGILTGFERRTPEGRNLDLPLETFARGHGYAEQRLAGSRLTVFRRP